MSRRRKRQETDIQRDQRESELTARRSCGESAFSAVNSRRRGVDDDDL
ncbi:hypothetical protein GCWU000341_00668 [Oribacterium sp. oral taxon 078 str. F0262]|nr:hypothetical protein GCWU000341_00668 [Oribacterium sp. oral taxon 078 str. F0262]